MLKLLIFLSTINFAFADSCKNFEFYQLAGNFSNFDHSCIEGSPEEQDCSKATNNFSKTRTIEISVFSVQAGLALKVELLDRSHRSLSTEIFNQYSSSNEVNCFQYNVNGKKFFKIINTNEFGYSQVTKEDNMITYEIYSDFYGSFVKQTFNMSWK